MFNMFNFLRDLLETDIEKMKRIEEEIESKKYSSVGTDYLDFIRKGYIAEQEEKEKNKMKIKKEKTVGIKDFLHQLVDESKFSSLNSDREPYSYDNSIVFTNIELITDEFPNYRTRMVNGELLVTFLGEVEIDEDTDLDGLVEVTEGEFIHQHHNTSIREQKYDGSLEFHALINGKLIKIWDKEKGMLE